MRFYEPRTCLWVCAKSVPIEPELPESNHSLHTIVPFNLGGEQVTVQTATDAEQQSADEQDLQRCQCTASHCFLPFVLVVFTATVLLLIFVLYMHGTIESKYFPIPICTPYIFRIQKQHDLQQRLTAMKMSMSQDQFYIIILHNCQHKIVKRF